MQASWQGNMMHTNQTETKWTALQRVHVTTMLEYKIVSQCMTKPTKRSCAPSEDSDQPGHPPSLICVFTVRMKKAWVLCYPLSSLRRLSDWTDANADLSLHRAHISVCWFCHALALSQRTTKPTIRPVWPAKTRISLYGCAGWSESSLVAQVLL